MNCGTPGHSFRVCPEPVMSFGICAIKCKEKVPSYLLIRRRDSLSYVEFLRGKYSLSDPTYIRLLLDGMTVEERGRLLAHPFDTLWETLWNGQNTRQYRTEYTLAKRTFESLKQTGDLHGHLLAKYSSEATTAWTEAEWGFPKGRRALRETSLDCALREFKEETGLKDSILRVLSEAPLLEEYRGTNGIPYRQTYFMGICKYDTVATHQPMNRVMSREVGNIGWFSYEEAMEKIRPTNVEKRALLSRLHRRITEEGFADVLESEAEWTRV